MFGSSIAVGMLQGRASVVRQYVRWFPLHLVLNVAAIIFAVLISFRTFDMPAGLLALALAFVPIYERRLARSLLDQLSAP